MMENKTVFTLILVALILGAGLGIAVNESFDHTDMMGYDVFNASTMQADQYNFTTGCFYENGSGIVVDADGSGC